MVYGINKLQEVISVDVNKKALSTLCLGAMRFPDRDTAVRIIKYAIDNGINYIDTSPGYCRSSETENSERWIGSALESGNYRARSGIEQKHSG